MRKATEVDSITGGVAGSFKIMGGGYQQANLMAFVCPCGCGERGVIVLANDPEADAPKWSITGDSEDTITLSPSLNMTGFLCKWHGYLSDGYWKEV